MVNCFVVVSQLLPAVYLLLCRLLYFGEYSVSFFKGGG